MKLLKNIILPCLALLACAGCSKDDNEQQILENLASAKISIKVKSSASVTKAYNPSDLNELEGEANINNLAVIVFDETGNTLLGSKWEAVQEEHSAIITDVPAKATKARILIIANIDRDVVAGLSTYDDFQARLVELASQSQTSLTMSSQVIATKSALVEGDNYLGYADLGGANIDGLLSPILLTRLTARLDLMDINTDFAGSELLGRSVRIESISVYNQKNASHYFSVNDWGQVEADGHLENSAETSLTNAVINDEVSITNTPYVHYVMENLSGSAPTQISITATLLASDGYEAQTKIFRATINQNGLDKGYDHNYVKRNYVYRLHLSFGETSFDVIPTPVVPPTPEEPEIDTTSLSVTVEVVDWGPVIQDIVVGE